MKYFVWLFTLSLILGCTNSKSTEDQKFAINQKIRMLNSEINQKRIKQQQLEQTFKNFIDEYYSTHQQDSEAQREIAREIMTKKQARFEFQKKELEIKIIRIELEIRKLEIKYQKLQRQITN
jgi:DNA phosphorothioation-dependent restriction protein DptG